MAPRSLRDIVSDLTNEENQFDTAFIKNINEIFSHPKDQINQELTSLSDKTIFDLRESLFLEMIDNFGQETFRSANVLLDDENPLTRNLRKRYKASTCLEDINIFSLSLCENQLHKDIDKSVLSVKFTPQSVPTISTLDKGIIESMRDILTYAKDIFSQNNTLQREISNLKQLITDQKEEINELKLVN